MRFICWRSRVERELKFVLSMRFQEKEGKKDLKRSVGKRKG